LISCWKESRADLRGPFEVEIEIAGPAGTILDAPIVPETSTLKLST